MCQRPSKVAGLNKHEPKRTVRKLNVRAAHRLVSAPSSVTSKGTEPDPAASREA